jgi:hypothetical protein
MRGHLVIIAIAALLVTSGGPRAQPAPSKEEGLAAFETVKTVLQHPRCQNCHIPGNAPLQFDDGRVHSLGVQRGADGTGAPGLPCSTCHGTANPPASFGVRTPPGAPGWNLPPADKKMVFIGLSSGDLCRTVKDVKANGGKDMAALTEHVAHDKLVLWGWTPGAGRAPVSVPHDQFLAKWKVWAAAGAPCAP